MTRELTRRAFLRFALPRRAEVPAPPAAPEFSLADFYRAREGALPVPVPRFRRLAVPAPDEEPR